MLDGKAGTLVGAALAKVLGKAVDTATGKK